MVAAIREAFSQLHEAAKSGDTLAIVNADMGFHACLLSFCEHEMLRETLVGAQMLTRRMILYTKAYESDLESEIESHAPIVAAVEDDDPELLESLVRAHVIRAGKQLLQSFAEREVDQEAREYDRALAATWPGAHQG